MDSQPDPDVAKWERLREAVGLGEPHAVDPGELGEYAALLHRAGRVAATAAFPRAAAHLGSGCQQCAADIGELLGFLEAEQALSYVPDPMTTSTQPMNLPVGRVNPGEAGYEHGSTWGRYAASRFRLISTLAAVFLVAVGVAYLARPVPAPTASPPSLARQVEPTPPAALTVVAAPAQPTVGLMSGPSGGTILARNAPSVTSAPGEIVASAPSPSPATPTPDLATATPELASVAPSRTLTATPGHTLSPTHPPATATPPITAGLEIRMPREGQAVSERVTVLGTQHRALPPGWHVWLLVRADVQGARWYPVPGEIVARTDGMWSAEIYLGGPRDVRHEIRAGAVPSQTHAELVRHLSERRDQPLSGWEPPDSWGEARVTVVRQ